MDVCGGAGAGVGTAIAVCVIERTIDLASANLGSSFSMSYESVSLSSK